MMSVWDTSSVFFVLKMSHLHCGRFERSTSLLSYSYSLFCLLTCVKLDNLDFFPESLATFLVLRLIGSSD